MNIKSFALPIITIFILPLCFHYYFNNHVTGLEKLYTSGQYLFGSLGIAFLRTSLLSFYKTQKDFDQDFHPQRYDPQFDINKLNIFLRIKILLISISFKFSENYFRKLCEENSELQNFLENAKKCGEIELKHQKPYHLITIYTMKRCIQMASLTLYFTIGNFLIFILTKYNCLNIIIIYYMAMF